MGAQRDLGAGAAILGAASLSSLFPPVIHLTADDANQFYYTVLKLAAEGTLLVLLLIASRRWAFASSEPIRPSRHFRTLRTYMGTTSRDTDGRVVDLRLATMRAPGTWFRLPVVWVALGTLSFALYAWSVRYVETAIAATVYELWPAFLVVFLIRHRHTHDLYLNRRKRSQGVQGPSRNGSSVVEQVLLSLLAGVGLVFMLNSQSDSVGWLSELSSLSGSTGIGLALLAGAGDAAGVLGSLAFGRAAYYAYANGELHSDIAVEDRPDSERRILLWYTIMGAVAGRLLALPAALLVGLAVSGAYGGLSLLSALGGLTLGLVGAGTILLVRIGNQISDRPGVNALLFVSPAMALMWLLMLGVSLPRFDLFMVGAALILAINVLLQIKPDAERDYTQFGKEPLKGTRLGFTAFIMSIWMFGTVIYLRDDWFPVSRLLWFGGDYWGMLALSATVFSLILGFRMARLSARIAQEDDTMFELFRTSEHLVRQRVLNQSVIDALIQLDTAHPRSLLIAYNRVRTELDEAVERLSTHDGTRLPLGTEQLQHLLELERSLDLVAHSKQQGRDLVELMSLMAFALVTIGLGLFSRPIELGVAEQGWSGFLAEVFVLLLVSTVAFLAFNLFDVRRERETPLIVRVKPIVGSESRYRLFFRYKRDLAVEHAVAIVVSAAMAATFTVLLHGKWL